MVSTDTLRGQNHGVACLNASLTVNDLEKSIAWYRDVAGFHVEREFERDGRKMAASLKAGSVAILLAQDDGARERLASRVRASR